MTAPRFLRHPFRETNPGGFEEVQAMDATDADALAPADRDQVAAESLRILERSGGALPGERSLCLAVTDSDPRCLRRFGYAVLLRLIVGISGIAGGALIALISELGDADDSAWISLAFCISVGGILLLLSNAFFQRWFVRRQIGSRYDDLRAGAYTSLCCVGIEDAVTFDRFKLFPEDLGYLALDPARRLAVIEGIRFRYIIFGDDVRSVRQVAGATNTATAIDYMVGNVNVAIAVEHTSIRQELKRQLFGARQDPLIARLRATFDGAEQQ
jgi:hypothetical protein